MVGCSISGHQGALFPKKNSFRFLSRHSASGNDLDYTGSDLQLLVLSWPLSQPCLATRLPNALLLLPDSHSQVFHSSVDLMTGDQWAKAAFVSRKVPGVFWGTRLGKE